jgi:hypothetical protein
MLNKICKICWKKADDYARTKATREAEVAAFRYWHYIRLSKLKNYNHENCNFRVRHPGEPEYKIPCS